MPAIAIITGGVLAVVAYVYILANDERWLVVSILSYLLLFMHQAQLSRETAPPLDIPEILFSLIFFPGIILWFIKRFYAREDFIENWADIVLVIFMMYAFTEVLFAVARGFSFMKGLREFLLFAPLLLLFPIRRETQNDRGVIIVMWSLLLMSATVGLYIMVRYKIDLSSAKYLWQVIGNRQQREETLYMCSIILLFAFLAGKNFRISLSLPLLAINVFALAITFSRGYWITTVAGIFGLIFFLRGSARRRIVMMSGLALLLGITVGIIILPRVFGEFLTGLAERAGSISADALTIRSRLAESEVVLHEISTSPVVGYGPGALFSFYDIITNVTIRTWYIHNGYLFLLFKFGIVGFVMFFAMYAKRISALLSLWRRKSTLGENALVSALLVISLMMLFISFTSPQFFDKGALMILSVTWGIGDSLCKRVS